MRSIHCVELLVRWPQWKLLLKFHWEVPKFHPGSSSNLKSGEILSRYHKRAEISGGYLKFTLMLLCMRPLHTAHENENEKGKNVPIIR